ncbi:MAG: hypothetical protein AAF927_04000 [Bacteroidota bacterium]
MKRFFTHFLLPSLVVTLGFAFQPLEVPPLFATDELIEITLSTDLETYAKDRYGTPEYRPAKLSYKWQGVTYEAKAEIQARGRFRRDICDLPPIKLKVKKKSRIDLFEGQKSLKVVSECRQDNNQSVLREYYIYKAYNLFTEKSMRVRLLRLTLVDTKGKRPDQTSYAFFIEDDDAMAERVGATKVSKSVDLTNEDVDRNQQTLVHVFNYMIANRDFGVDIRQNVEVITGGSGGRPVVVPYDFDNSGMVNAPYTKPPGDTKSAYVTRRDFKALCRSEEEFQAVFTKFVEKRDEIIAMYENSPYLSPETVKESLKYYKIFYKTLKKKKSMAEIFRKACNPE